MKKLVIALIALSMVLGAVARADGGPSRGDRYDRNDGRPFKISEFFCAIAGGTAAGVIVKNAGASDPITFLGVLVGGLIGADFCRWVQDDKELGAQAAAFEAGLDSELCGSRKWSSRHYKGTLKVIGTSWRVGAGGGEVSTENICKLFETTIYEHNGKFIGRTTAWACKSPQNTWIVTKDNWIIKKDMKRCEDSRGHDGGSVSVGREPARPIPIEVGGRHGSWGLEQFRRRVNDYGVERGLKLALRAGRNDVEVGIMKAVSDDGLGVIVYMSPRVQFVAPISDIGIECRATGLCFDSEISTPEGLNGTLQYIFPNGEIVVNDVNRGIKRASGRGVRLD